MNPQISEFSYGYVLTDELIHWHNTPLTAAPVFPSLYEEGQQGGGWDVRLDRPGIPLFLQFKLSYCMVRNYALESRYGWLHAPFYRMHLRPSSHSDQHLLLLNLESEQPAVYYATPAFHMPNELNNAYFDHEIAQRSVFIRPSAIGPLPDDRAHHVAFQDERSGHFFLLSEPEEPKRIEGSDSKLFAKNVQGWLDRMGETAIREDSLRELGTAMSRFVLESYPRRPRLGDLNLQRVMEERSPLKQVAFLARSFFDCELFIVQLREPT